MCVAVFIPGQKPNDVSILQEVGCDKLFDHIVQPIFTDCLEGPGGQSGKLVYMNRGAALAFYKPEFQEWLDCGGYWLGISRYNRPTPELLQRDPLVDGHAVKLCDNNSWTVPLCDLFPKRLTINRETGAEERKISSEHADYIDKCNELFLWFIGDEFQEQVANEKIVIIPNGLTFAADALSKNYRVNCDLVDLLGLIDDCTAFAVARVATGLALAEQYAEAQKKTTNLAGSTS